MDPEDKDYEFVSGTKVARFNDDTTYAMMLLHDLLGVGPEWELMRQSVQINRPLERWAATIWRGGPGSGAWISWPTPSPLTYWEYDLFVHYWNRVVKECENVVHHNTVDETLHPLVHGWIYAGLAALLRWANGNDH